ncbi:MAG TPA: hypothetical protein VGE12_09165 [Noviherbaspirillum sp.]
MGTLTITSPAHVNGTSYAQNVGRAARALLDAILAFRTAATEETTKPVVRSAQEVRAKARENVSLYRLYTLSAPYDSIMPNLRQELEVMAGRDQ